MNQYTPLVLFCGGPYIHWQIIWESMFMKDE